MKSFKDLMEYGTIEQVVSAINAYNTEYEPYEMAAIAANGEISNLDFLIEAGAVFDHLKALELMEGSDAGI